MKRRTLLFLSALALGMPATLAFAGGVPHVPYSRDAYQQALASGKPLLVDFYASW